MLNNAIILSAGFGTRLKPLTDFVPKSLFPIVGKPALEIVMERLANRGVNNFFINAHHLAEKIVNTVPVLTPETAETTVVLEKEKILGTAGGIANIFNKMNLPQETILVHNGDIIENFDLESAFRFHRDNDFLVTLIVIDNPRVNSVLTDGEIVIGFDTAPYPSQSAENRWTYSGVAFLEPKIISTFPNDRFSSLTECIQPFLNKKCIGVRYEKNFWCDFGTPADYLELHRKILVEGKFRISGAGENIWLDENSNIPDTVEIYGFCAIGKNVHIYSGAEIANSVIWDNSIVENKTYINSIISPYGVVEVV
ncbi:hypothetical protein DRQ33_00550 [bacterium]|nr:MAG: hypothetical protein DRQ33_00550 [bacterium]